MITLQLFKSRIRSGNIIIALLFFWLLADAIPAYSQYFGRNKPSYRSFDFKVYESPNFTIYHYFENDSVINALANSFEKWYVRHQQLFRDTFEKPSPILIYENHPEFQQTTAIGGMIGIGTQGVTEALKNRVVIPVLETNAQTDHVIGHELVHVFHFRALFIDDSLSLNSLRNLPLWLVEGMAEYFSIGSVDAHTSMIIRDAVVNDDFPSLRDMTRDFSYNPYRYGHAFVAFLGRTWGDEVIAPLYRETAKFGYERAMERIIGLNANTVSNLWKSATKNHFEQFLTDSTMLQPVGQRRIDDSNGGHLNISPSLSPDGTHIAFFSERDLFSLDLFLANAETGRIIRKLSSTTRSSDIDAFNFFESVGTWSPDGSKFIHVAVKQGQNQLVVVDVNRPRRTRHIAVEGVPSLNNPTWSPDGRYVVFSGLVGGIGNLYMLDMETKEVERLTNDRYSYIHPTWSPDGNYLAFATDLLPGEFNPDTLSYSFNLGIMDMKSSDRTVRVLDVFPSAENLNPQFDPDQEGLYFLSNRDGFRNLYYLRFEDGTVSQLTDLYTGISGITHLSPAISVSRNTGKVAYSHFSKGKYFIYMAEKDDFTFTEVDSHDINMDAATLPPFNRSSVPVVDNFLKIERRDSIFPVDSFEVKPFRPQFGLTYIGSSGVGVATSRFGTGMQGGVAMMFSDIVGHNQLFSVLAVNGEIYDFGGQFGYVNQKHRINWGGTISHIPYPFAFLRFQTIEQDGREYLDYQYVIQRTFETQFGGFAYFPISTTRRIELSASHAWYYFRQDIFHTYYDRLTGFYAGQDRSRGDTRDGFNLQRVGLGYIGDNSYFGMASPMTGHRYRFSLEKMFGRVDMYSGIADYRRYFFRHPFSVAFRASHFGRYGKDAENDLFYPLYLGYPTYMRGFDYNSLAQISDRIPGVESQEDFSRFLDNLIGTRMLLGGLELKVPFTGPERLALISSGFFFTELGWFLDAGIAWREGQSLGFNLTSNTQNERYAVFSTGPSLRINLFGALVLEPYYAIPFTVDTRLRGVWGLNFWPGW
jgi:Tol biopolymer transport system component